MKKITIKDIARIADVSRGTVDRVINERGSVAPEVRTRILKIAKELGYEKNYMASALAINKVFKLAIVCPDPESDLFWRLPREGFQMAINLVKHYGIVVEYFDFNLFNKDEFIMQMGNAIQSTPDAILVAPVFLNESQEFLRQALVAKIPFITINTEIQHKDVLCYIGQNSYYSGFLAGRLFQLQLEPGDEVIALNLGHNLSNAPHYSDKLAGLEAYFKQQDMNHTKVSWYEFDQFLDKTKLRTFFDSIVEKHPKMKAIFFTNSRAYRIVELMTKKELDAYHIIGYDMIEPNIKLLKEEKIDFIINQNPIQQGYMGIINFVNHFILKKEINETQYLPLDIVVKENVDFYLDKNLSPVNFN